MRILIAFLLFLPITAFAQEFTTTLSADLTGDGLRDHVELTQNSETLDADLNIWVRQTNGDLKLRANAPSVVWVGGIGQKPELSVTAHGSLQVHSMNDSIGRNRWHQTLTLAWRNKAFVMAGYTYDSYDTLDLDLSIGCDVNLLNGKGERLTGANHDIKTNFRTQSRGGPIDDWNGEAPKECDLGN